ncbi:MAG: PKD domain-containing protein [Flavobacteriales bacterium]|nr:PKD domain-containing protein [Flavobacteriales bacterium]
MAQKLNDLTTSYHSFENDQVLTADQLNEFLEYFDEQDRLSRICLSGVGITCGFELSTNSENHITIGKGAGVTTDGDLIHLVKKKSENGKTLNVFEDDKLIYKYYRAYTGEKVNYDPQFNKLDSVSDFEIIPLIEVVSEQEKQDGDKDLSELNLNDKIALFYLECYPKEADNCVGVDCDNQGIEQVNKLRVLLVDLDNVDRITKNDELFNSYVTFEAFLETKTVYVPRVILNKTNTKNITELARAYQDEQPIKDSIENLTSGVGLILNSLGKSDQAIQFNSNMNRIFSANTGTNKVLFQYKYDLLKDLADSYNELKELFLENYSTCCPSITAFPKHLLLGRLKEPGEEITYRHKFHKSPILMDNDDGNGRFESVIERILTMVSPNGFLNRNRFKSESIRITPSNVRVPLAKRAVPFYYRFSEKLMKNWDFDKRKFNRYKSILGYRQALEYPNNYPISTPLQYTLDAYNFFRIEGHQGSFYDDVFEELTKIKEDFSLPFDIKVLGINVEEFDELLEDQYKCDFRDLNVLLDAWSSEQECIASEVTRVLSSFSTKYPGKNIIENDFYSIKRATYFGYKGEMTNNELGPDLYGDKVYSRKMTYSESEYMYDNTADSKATAGKTTGTNPILTYINNEPNTVGYYLDQSIKNANGNYANALAYTANELYPRVNQWEDAIVDSTVKLPLQIMVACTSLIELIPNSIEELSDSTLDSYNVEIEKLCSYTKQLQNKYQSPNLVAKITEKTRSMVSLLINQLTVICCSSKKLQALLEEVKERKESILERLNFSKFAENHPGLEHKAGAGPGETFVIVYVNHPVQRRIKDTIGYVKDALNNSMEIEQPKKFYREAERSFERMAVSVEGDPTGKTAKEESSEKLVIDETGKTGYFGRFETIIRKGAVVADFTLPYLCCSDCAPISFVLPKIPVSLTLSDTTYCIDDSNKQIDLTITPDDGVVTVVDAVPGVNILGKKLNIDGTIFPEELLGTVLKFKVDGEETDAELLVSKTPVIDFALPEPGANRIVNFTVSGDDSPDFTYLWEFGDGMTSTEREPTHDYSDSGARDEFIVTLTVTGIGAVCPKVVSHTLTFVEVTVSVETDIVCEDGDPIPFIISPEGATADIKGDGVNEKKTHFDPSLVGPGSYPMIFDGNVFATITVKSQPEITSKIITKVNDVDLDLSVEAKDVETYAWTITLPDGKTRTSVKSNPSIPFEVIDGYKAGEEINIAVKLSNKCGNVSTEISWVIPDKSEPNAQLDQLRYCSNDKTVYDFTIENFTSNTVIEGEGVNAAVKPPTFSPMGLVPGEYDITVDGKVVDTVIVVDKPTIEIAELNSTVNGLAASATVPTGVTEESLVWKFLDPESGATLHESILGKKSIEVNFSDFTDEKWTSVRVVVTGLAGPCGPVTTNQTFSRPLEVSVALPRYNFCVGDTASYKFSFTPDTGTVTMSGSGVDSTGTSFSPGGLAAGSYILTASNGNTLSVTIYEKPTLQIGVITSQTNGFSTSTVLPAGVLLKSVQWTFTHPATGEELHPPIAASTSIQLDFNNFTNEWTDVEITLSAIAGPCGSISDSAKYTKPVIVDVTVSLPKYTFCQDDKGTYDFIFTPDQPMMMSGPGVNTTGTAFSPNGLTPGSYTIVSENGDQLTVNIVDSRIGTMNTPVYDNQKNEITLSFTPIGGSTMLPNVEWRIGREELGDLPGSTSSNYTISTEKLKLAPGDTLLYEMILTSELCGTKQEEGSFKIPSVIENCETTMFTELDTIRNNAPTPTLIQSFFKDQNDQEAVGKLYNLLDSMMKNAPNVVGGQMNDEIVNEIGGFLKFLEGKINEALEMKNENLLNFLTRLYRMAVAMYAIAFRCQDQFDFKDFPSGIALNNLLKSHFDASNPDSLISKSVKVFDSTNTGPFVELLNEKGVTKQPWMTIEFIISA